MLTRRRFCQTTAFSTAALMLPGHSAFGRHGRSDGGPFEVTELRDGAVALGSLSDGGMVLVAPTSEGAIVVDAKFSYTADDLVRQIRSLTGSLPGLLVNTHHHGDHTGGNWMFKAMEVSIVSHLNALKRIEDNFERYKSSAERAAASIEDGTDDKRAASLKRQAQAVQTLDFRAWIPSIGVGKEWRNRVGGKSIEMHHFGAGHTDNDAIFQLADWNIVHMGDLLFHNVHPFIDKNAGATTVGWQNSLAKALELCDKDTIVVAGHGGVTDRSGIEAMSVYFDQLREIVGGAIREGKSRDDVIAMKPDAFADRGFEQLRGQALGVMYDELTAQPAVEETTP